MGGYKWVACAAALAAVPALAKDTKSMEKSSTEKSSMDKSSTEKSSMGETASADKFESNASKGVKEAIEKRSKQYEKDWNAHDVDAMAKYYTADATVMNAEGKTATGKAAIKQQLQSDEQAMGQAQTTITVDSVRQLSPTLALADITQHVEGAKPPQGMENQQMPTDFHVNVIAKKEGSNWMVQAIRVAPMPQSQMGVGGSGMQTTPTTPDDSNMQQPDRPTMDQQQGTHEDVGPNGMKDNPTPQQ